MKRISFIIFPLLAVGALTACSAEDVVPTVSGKADGVMRLSADSCDGVLVSVPRQVRDATSDVSDTPAAIATSGYNFYDPLLHPTTMGGFGFKRHRTNNQGKKWDYIFLEDTETHVSTGANTDLSSGHTKHAYNAALDHWDYFKADGKTKFTEKWNATNYDYHVFFAYMPYQPGGTKDGTEYKVNLWQGNDQKISLRIPFIPGITHEPYMVCHEPQIRVLYTDDTKNDYARVPFKMDQIMQRFVFSFKLSSAMSAVRHFHIEKVELYGSNLPATATYTRHYIYSVDDNENVTWRFTDENYDGVVTHNIEEKDAFQVKRPVWKNHGTTEYYLPLVSSDYRDYGRTYSPIDNEGRTPPSYLYFIYASGVDFHPVIKVTYTIFDEKGYETRQGVGRVVFNWDNFSKDINWQKGIAYSHNIKINIVPNRLYILSDADQTQGYLVVEE